MVDKILFTSSSKTKLESKDFPLKNQKKNSFLLLVLIFPLCCTPKLGWIRTLPNEFPKDSKLVLGTYNRPTEKKSAMGSKDFQLLWSESIYIQPNLEFKKIWREWRVYKDYIQFRQVIGKGQFEKSNEWVLFKTNEVNTKECRVERTKQTISKQFTKRIPCETFQVDQTKKYDHRLLYLHETNSLYPLSYESGYEEANFGIAWESDIPYQQTKLFEIAKLKFGKKEFQPHVYHHVKLD
ncbi:hypothetical protein AB3N60_04905 [Leptospira sp. WS39.C2]